MNESINALKNSTKLLAKTYKGMPITDKIDTLSQIKNNLMILKINMETQEYSKSFGKLEKSIDQSIKNITDPSFIDELVIKINNFIKDLNLTK